MGTIKDRSNKDLTEAEEIKRDQKNTQKNSTIKGLNDPDNHDDVVTQITMMMWLLTYSQTSYSLKSSGP